MPLRLGIFLVGGGCKSGPGGSYGAWQSDSHDECRLWVSSCLVRYLITVETQRTGRRGVSSGHKEIRILPKGRKQARKWSGGRRLDIVVLCFDSRRRLAPFWRKLREGRKAPLGIVGCIERHLARQPVVAPITSTRAGCRQSVTQFWARLRTQSPSQDHQPWPGLAGGDGHCGLPARLPTSGRHFDSVEQPDTTIYGTDTAARRKKGRP